MQLLILLLSLFSTVLSVNEVKCNGSSVCIQKCCDLNYNLHDTKCVFQEYTELKVPVIKNGKVASVNFEKGDFVSASLKCYDDMKNMCIKLQPDVNPNQSFFVESNGNLRVPFENVSINVNEYCLDYYNGEILAVVRVSSRPRNVTRTSHRLTAIGSAISLPFLFVTFVVYALLPKRNLHGKCLMSFVFVIFWVYLAPVCLYYNPLHVSFRIEDSRIIMYCFFYGALASFFWLNAMCFDICSTFSGVRGFTKNKKQTERRRFIIYSIYAWNMPFLFISLIVILSNVLSSNEWYDPGVRDKSHWIRGGIQTAIFMYGPLATLMVANAVLFIKTSWRIKKTRDKTAVLREKENMKHSTANDDKQTFKLYIKLFFGMGINMAAGIIDDVLQATNVDVPEAVWYIFDFSNAAYGAFIFFIFVFKKSIWIQLKKRFCPGVNNTLKPTSPLKRRNEDNVKTSADTETNVPSLVTTEST